MNILILGAGNMGSVLASQAARAGHAARTAATTASGKRARLPSEPPNWFWRKGGGEGVWAKKLRASSALLRRNSNIDPCSEFVPDCVTTLTCAPGRFPYSAL